MKNFSFAASSLPEYLRCFDVKERATMVRHMLGTEELSLSDEQIQRITQRFGIEGQLLFSCPDFPLDFLFAAITLFSQSCCDCGQKMIFPNHAGTIKATSEDTDWVLLFSADHTFYDLILLEGKGFEAWSNPQLDSKLLRLSQFFGKRGNQFPTITPHFGLLSPKPPQRVKKSNFPAWALDEKKKFFHFRMPTREDAMKVIRCNESGSPDKYGQFFSIVARR